MIFLDNASTTRPFPEATALAAKISDELYFNASATYRAGIESFHAVSDARERIAALLGVLPSEVYFTSGGTESDNISVFGGFKNKRGRVVTTEIEHPAVLQCMGELKSRGADVRFVRILSDGSIDREHFESLFDEEVALVSVMQVNNETGVVNDVAGLARFAKSKYPTCVVHSDGVQGFLKSPIDLSGIDLYSVSSHKINGPKGIGALYLNRNLHIKSPIFGGGQEKGIRSGTENTPAICGFALAAELYASRRAETERTCRAIKTKFLEIFTARGLDFRINGGIAADGFSIVQPNITNVSFRGMKAEILYQLLSDRDIYISRGSACSTKIKTSKIAAALNLPKDYADGTMRISSGYGNTVAEAETAAAAIADFVEKYRILG